MNKLSKVRRLRRSDEANYNQLVAVGISSVDPASCHCLCCCTLLVVTNASASDAERSRQRRHFRRGRAAIPTLPTTFASKHRLVDSALGNRHQRPAIECCHGPSRWDLPLPGRPAVATLPPQRGAVPRHYLDIANGSMISISLHCAMSTVERSPEKAFVPLK